MGILKGSEMAKKYWHHIEHKSGWTSIPKCLIEHRTQPLIPMRFYHVYNTNFAQLIH